MNGIGTQKTIKKMKHYHRSISRSDRLKYPSVENFREKLCVLDPKPGECLAMFRSKDNKERRLHSEEEKLLQAL